MLAAVTRGAAVFSAITDGVSRQIEGAMASVSGAFFEPVVRLGVTGLSRAGKTVFITGLVANLLDRGRMPQLRAQAEGRIEAVQRDHFQNIARGWFTIERRLVGRLRHNAHAVEDRAREREEFVHALVAAVNVVEGIQAAADAGLVGDDEDPPAHVVEAADHGLRAIDPLEILAAEDIAVIDVDDAVAVEKEGGARGRHL